MKKLSLAAVAATAALASPSMAASPPNDGSVLNCKVVSVGLTTERHDVDGAWLTIEYHPKAVTLTQRNSTQSTSFFFTEQRNGWEFVRAENSNDSAALTVEASPAYDGLTMMLLAPLPKFDANAPVQVSMIVAHCPVRP